MGRPMPTFAYLFLAVFLAIGLGILGYGLQSLRKALAVGDWPTVEGRFLEREFTEDRDSDSTTYRVTVRYAYRVNDREYTGDRLAFGYGGSSGRESHQRIYRTLMRGDAVLVRYNPADPAEAVLSKGLNTSILTLLIFGLIWTGFTLGGASLVYLMHRPDHGLIEGLVVG